MLGIRIESASPFVPLGGASLRKEESKKPVIWRDHGHLGMRKELAATYSRGGYTTTTIGNAAFDGRVREGIGSDHSFMATKKS